MMSGEIYIARNTIDEFRWVGFEDFQADGNNAAPFGLMLAKLRWDPLRDRWNPPPIRWLSEMMDRKTCDFPTFRSGIWCLSHRAFEALGELLERSGELLPLEGLGGEYRAFNCLERYNALHHVKMEAEQARDPYFSISSTRSKIHLVRSRIGHADIFKIPQALTHTFVSNRFKALYENASLTGLDFIPIEVE
jgi:hypothetical protein